MALIWRVLPLLFLANTVYGKIEFDALAYSYCIKDGFSAGSEASPHVKTTEGES